MKRFAVVFLLFYPSPAIEHVFIFTDIVGRIPRNMTLPMQYFNKIFSFLAFPGKRDILWRRIFIMYTTETTMLGKLAAGENISWKEFYASYLPLIRNIANRKNIPANDIDDLVQETAAALFNDGKFNYRREVHGKFRTYLGGIIRHKIADFFRKDPPSANNQDETVETVAPEFESIYLAEYRKYILSLAIEELKSRVSPESFEVFQLCILREIPDKDAAKMLDSKPNTISVRKKRCREILQSIIVRLNDDDPVLGLKSL